MSPMSARSIFLSGAVFSVNPVIRPVSFHLCPTARPDLRASLSGLAERKLTSSEDLKGTRGNLSVPDGNKAVMW